MHYEFLIVISVAALVAAPFMLIGANREAKRRHEREKH